VNAREDSVSEMLKLLVGWSLDHANKIINIHFQQLEEGESDVVESSGRVPGGGRHKCSRGWGGNAADESRSSWAISRMVSEAEQKKASDLHQPIWRQVGTTIMGSSSGSPGRT